MTTEETREGIQGSTREAARKMAGRATADATARHALAITERQQLPPGAFRLLGRTGLTTSALGFGGYRLDGRDDNHAGALRQALRRGVNLIDTSSNYTGGASETLIGRILAELETGAGLEAEAGREAGEEAGQPEAEPGALRARTILVSKVGYVQGQNMEIVRRAASAGRPFAEMVEYDPTCWHCIHPDFIADQLARSLARLGVRALDVYLLHNPEYFFSDWAKNNPGENPGPAREVFYGRVASAFRFLEQCVAEERIGWYGVSSNTFGADAGQVDFVSLERLIALGDAAARAVRGAGAASGFAVVQCPLNLMESGALLLPNQDGGSRTFLEVAEAAGLAVLANRPLNAIRAGRLIRFADAPVARPGIEQEIEVALDALLAEEQTFAGLFRPSIQDALPENAGPHAPFEWSGPLRRAVPRVGTREQWNAALERQIYPQLEQAARFVRQSLGRGARERDFSSWFREYCRKLEAVAGAVAEWLGREDFERARDLHARLDPLLEPSRRGLTLSQKALLPLLSLSAVSCVLNGMRRPSYVEDSTVASAIPGLGRSGGEAVLRAFSETAEPPE